MLVTANAREYCAIIDVKSLDATDSPGLAQNFDPAHNYTWQIANATGGVSGFDPSHFRIVASEFENPISGSFALSSDGGTVNLNYITAVPEPTSVVLLSLSALGLVTRRKRFCQ